MDILKILKESYADMYPEDFDFLETELATGDYDPAYIAECRKQLAAIRNAASTPAEEKPVAVSAESTPAEEKPASVPEAPATAAEPEKPVVEEQPAPQKKLLSPELVMMGENEFEPKKEPEQVSPVVTLQRDLLRMRRQHGYLAEFKKYVKANSSLFTSEFLDTHFSVLFPPEMDAVIMICQMGEPFLEKYFGALDHDKVARYQLFSESFFIKHYVQLPAETVLRHGKNEWRLKEKRSQKLSVFLRLKGIQY